ncbi:MAG: cation transporter [Candidatus Marinimicrobia bacterium]|nr:cation transporter [Candidatus Neomarinimicrobiota bacterium]
MHCDACVSKVEQSILALDGVLSVAVDLASKRASITGEVQSDALIEAIKEVGYESFITEDEQKKTETHINDSPSQARQLFPLFLIFFYITVFSIMMNRSSFHLGGFMYDFMVLFYIVFSFFKFLDYKNFPSSFSMYDPIAKIFPLYGWIYPVIETILGLFFLLRYQLLISLVATILILGITTIGVTRSLMDKANIQCACLGTALKLPMTKATFIENFVMILMAIWMLLSGDFYLIF